MSETTVRFVASPTAPPAPGASRGAYESLKAKYLAAQVRFERLEDLTQSADHATIRVEQERGELPSPGLVSIVIPVFNQPDLTRACIASLRTHTFLDHEIVLVDNGSNADTRALLLELQRDAVMSKRVRVIENQHNEGFAFATNQGIAAAKGEWIVLLNNDVVVTERWLARMLAFATLDSKVGLIGPRSNRASGPQQVEGADYRDLGAMERFAKRATDRRRGEFSLQTRLVGLCLLVSRKVIDTIGGLDTCFFPGNLEDDDFCLRAVRAGFQPVIVDDVFVHHAQSATFRAEKFDYSRTLHDNWRWFCAKHGHHGEYGPYPARHLALARDFDRDVDLVPVNHASVCNPDVKPLQLEGARGRRVLVFADSERGAWQERVRSFLQSTDAAADTTLVLRIDPPEAALVNAVVARVEEIVKATGKPDAELPDVLAEISPLAPAQRGTLYTAVHRLLLTGSPRDRVYRREAEACGVEIGDAAS